MAQASLQDDGWNLRSPPEHCVQVIGSLRRLGLTNAEIRRLAAVYVEKPEEPIGPHLITFLVTLNGVSTTRSESWRR